MMHLSIIGMILLVILVRGESRSGTKKVLIVKVIDKNDLQRPESPTQMSADVFGPIPGTATASIIDNVNMASQFRACSFNKLNMIPHGGDNYNNAPGVITITGVVSLESNSRNAIRNDCISKANAKTGVNLASTNEWDHVIFVLQKCYVGKYVFV